MGWQKRKTRRNPNTLPASRPIPELPHKGSEQERRAMWELIKTNEQMKAFILENKDMIHAITYVRVNGKFLERKQ